MTKLIQLTELNTRYKCIVHRRSVTRCWWSSWMDRSLNSAKGREEHNYVKLSTYRTNGALLHKSPSSQAVGRRSSTSQVCNGFTHWKSRNGSDREFLAPYFLFPFFSCPITEVIGQLKLIKVEMIIYYKLV